MIHSMNIFSLQETHSDIRICSLRIAGVYLGAVLDGRDDESEQLDASIDFIDFFYVGSIAKVPEMVLMKYISKVDGIIIGVEQDEKVEQQKSGLKWANFFAYHKKRPVFVRDVLISHKDYRDKVMDSGDIGDFRQLLWMNRP